MAAGLTGGGVDASGTGQASCDPGEALTCSLRDLATLVDFRIGATAEGAEVLPGTHSETLAREFNSLTPENALKWYSIQPTKGSFDWGPADAVVNFGVANGMEIRGHTLVWAQDRFIPTWVRDIADPATMRGELGQHISAVVGRYQDRVHRWDVVNEPLQTLGTGISDNIFARVLGPGWIEEIFGLAADADPSAELWLNEFGTDFVPGKHAALLALVSHLVERGTPIHGVGLQMHRPGTRGPNTAALESQIRGFTELGLEVAITELDIPVSPTDPEAFSKQADAYRRVVGTCLAVDGCVEVTTWGVTDAHTWLDSQGLHPTPTRPLLFDLDYSPKPAYFAIHQLLADLLRPVPTTTETVPSTTTTGSTSSPFPAPDTTAHSSTPPYQANAGGPAEPVNESPRYAG